MKKKAGAIVAVAALAFAVIAGLMQTFQWIEIPADKMIYLTSGLLIAGALIGVLSINKEERMKWLIGTIGLSSATTIIGLFSAATFPAWLVAISLNVMHITVSASVVIGVWLMIEQAIN